MAFTPSSKNTDPNNVQVKKGFVFNETGNIMMATTDMDSAEIEQSVRDVFAEVSVFFGAMTKALDQHYADAEAAEEDDEDVDENYNVITSKEEYDEYIERIGN